MHNPENLLDLTDDKAGKLNVRNPGKQKVERFNCEYPRPSYTPTAVMSMES